MNRMRFQRWIRLLLFMGGKFIQIKVHAVFAHMNPPLIQGDGKINGIYPLSLIWCHPYGLTKKTKYKTLNPKKQEKSHCG